MKKIFFEDRGQDFLWWIIDSEGNVIDCGPFHVSVWVESKVYLEDLKVGEHLLFIDNYGDDQLLIYPVVKIENWIPETLI